MDITFLQKNYLFVLLSLILALILTAVMNLGIGEKDRDSYIRTAIISVVISSLAVYIHTLVPTIEEIAVTPPPF